MAKKQKHLVLKAGRKAADGADGLKRHNVMLDAETVKTAVEIGLGSLSVGIRKAVKEYKNDNKRS